MTISNFHRKLLRRFQLPGMLTAASVSIRDRRFVTPRIGRTMCEPGEPWMIDILEQLLARKPGQFLDVGVNLGQTLLAVKALDPSRRYVGVEPNPQCVAYAEQLVSANGFTDCLIVPAALGSDAGIRMLQLYYGNGTDPSASLVEGFRPEQPISRLMPVAVYAYPEIERAAGLSDVAIVKIDVEGAESEVIASMADMVRRQQPWLVVEVLPAYGKENTDRLARQGAIEASLADLDYAILRIRKHDGAGLDRLEPLDQFGIHSDLALSDYVLCPRADASELAATIGRP